MSNLPSHPLVDPNDYDRNKKMIASYRRYLDMYENVNEQGLRNHEELERMERMLQEQVRQGEEARRQLALMQQSESRMRITDGRTPVPNINGFISTAPPVGMPNVQAASTSAYIEEIHDNRVPTNVSNTNYSHYSASTQSQAPQPVHYNQQHQQNHPTSSHFGPQFSQQIPRNVAIPPQQQHQQTAQTNPNAVHHHQPRNDREFQPTLQQIVHHTNQMQQSDSQASRNTQATRAAAQSEQWQRMQQQQNQIHRQTPVAKEVLVLPPRYYPSAETSTTTNQRPTPHQSQAPINAQQRRGAPQDVPVSNKGQMQHGRVKVTSPIPAPSDTMSTTSNNVPSSFPQVANLPASSLYGALGSNQQTHGIAPAPKSSFSAFTPKSTPQVPYASSTPSVSFNNADTKDAPLTGALYLPRPPTGVLLQSAPQSATSTAQGDPPSNNFPPPPAPNVVTQIISGSSTFQPSTPNSSTVNRLASPKRTPKDADKKFLARDLLRALKRPRPEALSSTLEPEPKRHAPTTVVGTTGHSSQHFPAASTFQSIATTQPPPPTSSSTSPPSPRLPAPRPSVIPPTVAAVATAPVTDVQKVAPSPNPLPPSTNTAVSSDIQTPSQFVHPLAQAQPATMEPISTLLQKYPNTWNALSSSTVPSLREKIQARINQVSSFGHFRGNASSSLSRGTAAAESPKSKLPQKPAPEANHITTVGPVARAPLQPLASKTDQTPEQHLRPDVIRQPLRSEQVQPQPLSTAPVSTPAPASAATLVSPAPAKAPANVPIIDGSQNATVVEVPKLSVPGNGVGSSKPLPSAPAELPLPEKEPLFLPSPSSSPQPLGPNNPAGDIPQKLLTRSPKGKGTVITSPSRSPYSRSPLPAVAQVEKSIPFSGSAVVFDGVLVPPLPEYVKAWKKEERKYHHSAFTSRSSVEDQRGALSRSRSLSLGDFVGPPRSPSPSTSDFPVGDFVDHAVSEESDTDEDLDSWDLHFVSYDDAEKEVLHENSRMLRVSHCRWLECEVALNSPGALLRHLGVVHGPKRINAESPWTCQWMGCGHTFISRDDYRQHIERHSVFPLICPYHDCPENFRTPRQLIKHKRSDHGDDIVQRRTADPLVVTAPKGPVIQHVPKTIPSYIYEYEHVRATSITRQRHEVIIPSILRRISGNVPTQLQSYNAARPMPTPLRDQTPPPPTNTPYSFLLNRSTRYSSYLSSPAKSRNFLDVGSSYITELVKRGMVLWPQEDGEAVPETMLKELEELEVEGELLDGGEPAEGCDVFGPTIAIEPPRPDIGSGGGDDVIPDGSGVGS